MPNVSAWLINQVGTFFTKLKTKNQMRDINQLKLRTRNLYTSQAMKGGATIALKRAFKKSNNQDQIQILLQQNRIEDAVRACDNLGALDLESFWDGASINLSKSFMSCDDIHLTPNLKSSLQKSMNDLADAGIISCFLISGGIKKNFASKSDGDSLFIAAGSIEAFVKLFAELK